MYDFGRDELDCPLAPGTNILVTGPPLVGKRRFAMEALAAGTQRGDGAVAVTTRDTADRIRTEYRTLADGDGRTLDVVDTVRHHIGEPVGDDRHTKYVSSPGETTAIGVKLSEFVQSYRTDRDIDRLRVLVDSLTPVLIYAPFRTVYRSVHAFTSRVDTADALGLYTLTSTAHDDDTVETLTRLFDGTVALTDSGTATLRLPGRDERTVEL